MAITTLSKITFSDVTLRRIALCGPNSQSEALKCHPGTVTLPGIFPSFFERLVECSVTYIRKLDLSVLVTDPVATVHVPRSPTSFLIAIK
jgi:hypothetical protein